MNESNRSQILSRIVDDRDIIDLRITGDNYKIFIKALESCPNLKIKKNKMSTVMIMKWRKYPNSANHLRPRMVISRNLQPNNPIRSTLAETIRKKIANLDELAKECLKELEKSSNQSSSSNQVN